MKHEPWNFPPQGLPPPEKEPASYNEMRQAMLRAYRDDNTIHAVFQQADYLGLNGEDRYTQLAYYALRRVHDLWKLNIQFANSMPAPLLKDLNRSAGSET
ncbi:MAG TPA: hypothetical protein VHN11_04950 [Xanthobacteraceae bacterium]|jgi:hypothetical protein|nr:hypothetical protein [Xanthobacteraceae bacterium]